jgi:hypothetical protein
MDDLEEEPSPHVAATRLEPLRAAAKAVAAAVDRQALPLPAPLTSSSIGRPYERALSPGDPSLPFLFSCSVPGAEVGPSANQLLENL